MTTAIVFSRQTNAGPRASLNFLVIYFFFGLNIRIKVVNPSTTATPALSWLSLQGSAVHEVTVHEVTVFKVKILGK